MTRASPAPACPNIAARCNGVFCRRQESGQVPLRPEEEGSAAGCAAREGRTQLLSRPEISRQISAGKSGIHLRSTVPAPLQVRTRFPCRPEIPRQMQMSVLPASEDRTQVPFRRADVLNKCCRSTRCSGKSGGARAVFLPPPHGLRFRVGVSGLGCLGFGIRG